MATPAEVAILLAKIKTVTEKRDAKLAEVNESLRDAEAVDPWLDFIHDVQRHQLYHFKEQAASMANSISGAAKLAEDSSQRVKELDSLHNRVASALSIVDGILAQRESVKNVASALNDCDYEKAAECISSYDKTTQSLKDLAINPSKESTSVDGDGEPDGKDGVVDEDGNVVVAQNPDELIRTARDKLQTSVMRELESATVRNDAGAMIRFSKICAKIGLTEEGCSLYSKWVRTRASQELAELVDSSLSQIKSGSTASSHLLLVSQVLDHVVVTLEREEKHIQETFGNKGHGTLLSELHNECTRYSVQVLQNFLSEKRLSSASPGKGERREGSSRQDPRMLDRNLEEMSHLMSCCHLYFSFMDKKFAEVGVQVEPKANVGKKQQQQQQYNRVVTANNPLFEKVQELVAIFVPMQRDYFDSAVRAAIQLEGTRRAPQSPVVPGSQKESNQASLMGALTSWTGNSTPAEDLQDCPEINAVDDIFYVLRVAMHRAMGTKSQSIVSAVLIAVNEVVKDKLGQEFHRRITFRKDVAAVPSRTLKWINAQHKAKEYTAKLAKECIALAEENFESHSQDILRFKEQIHDLDLTATSLGESLAKATSSVVVVLTNALFCKGFPEFMAFNYAMTESGSAACELTDPWVRNATPHWDTILSFYRSQLNEANYEAVLQQASASVARYIEEIVLKKAFDQYGGLQFDKDLRLVKQFFTQKTERPIRDKFARISFIASLLLVDKALEVQDLFEAQPSGSAAKLTEAEVKAVLQQRNDFPKDALATLKLT